MLNKELRVQCSRLACAIALCATLQKGKDLDWVKWLHIDETHTSRCTYQCRLDTEVEIGLLASTVPIRVSGCNLACACSELGSAPASPPPGNELKKLNS